MDLKKILGNLGCTALSTQLPPFGGIAASMIKKALGLDEKATEKEIAVAIEKATPEQMLAIKEADNKFILDMEEAGLNILELDKEDRESARKFAKDTGSGSINRLSTFNAVFVLIITLSTFALAYQGKISNMGALEASILTLLIREAFGRYEQVCNFFFGSSHGSKQKTDIMGKK